MKWEISALAAGLLAVAAMPADALRVAVTGDSLTNAYAVHLDPTEVEAQVFATGGIRSWVYAGLAPNKHGETRDYAAEVIASNPDVIVLMLGTNDATQVNVADLPTEFMAIMESTLDRFEASGAAIVLAVPPPIVAPRLASQANVLATVIRPWLVAEALERNLHLVDFWLLVQTLPDWQNRYVDGLHLDTAGELWMAEQVTQAAQLVPEPSSSWLVTMTCPGLWWAARRSAVRERSISP